MISLEVKGAREMVASLNRAAVQYPRVVQETMFRIGLSMREKLVFRMSASTIPGGFWGRLSTRQPGYISVRSGETRRRISAPAVIQRGTEYEVKVGSPDAHVAFLERGGTVTGGSPKGFLRIPTREMQTAAGVDRLTGASATTIVGGFIVKSKAGNLWIATRGRARELVLLYLLKKSVRVRGRGIFGTVAKEMVAVVKDFGNAALAMIARIANRG